MTISVGNGPDKWSSFWLSIIRITIGALWIKSGVQKVMDGEFTEKIEGTIAYLLSGDVPGWFLTLFETYITPNAATWAQIVQWGEIVIGALLIIGLFVNLAALGGVFLNSTFFFLASWSSPSTWSLNLLLIIIQMVILLSSGSKALSVDKKLFRKRKVLRKVFLNKKNMY